MDNIGNFDKLIKEQIDKMKNKYTSFNVKSLRELKFDELYGYKTGKYPDEVVYIVDMIIAYNYLQGSQAYRYDFDKVLNSLSGLIVRDSVFFSSKSIICKLSLKMNNEMTYVNTIEDLLYIVKSCALSNLFVQPLILQIVTNKVYATINELSENKEKFACVCDAIVALISYKVYYSSLYNSFAIKVIRYLENPKNKEPNRWHILTCLKKFCKGSLIYRINTLEQQNQNCSFQDISINLNKDSISNLLANSIEIYSSPTNTTEIEVKVYKAILELNNFLAIKTIKGYESRNSLKELSILKDLSGKKQCFLQLFGDYIIGTTLYIITEYIESTLEDKINKNKIQNQPFSNDEADEIIIQLLEGFAFLKSKSIYHQDIKPQNILIKNRDIKIIDFGVSTTLTTEENSINLYTPQGSPIYAAPEIKDALMERVYDKEKQVAIEYDIEKADIFSLGLMILQIITLQDIVGLNSSESEENRNNLVQKISGWKGRLLAGMLCNRPTERFTFKNALSYIPSKSTVI
ncbi:hypothetical protein SteCoe_12099 [Stentor coeruleus]|uniref:Protein kinase domain-containing protein n=1 Tax=Stentor coeruleus TaxID=5963 RepID=A0A1R2CBL6_9CILI|nr:hypothetical protein SteCoe_12099 [Stentor coeruleus]